MSKFRDFIVKYQKALYSFFIVVTIVSIVYGIYSMFKKNKAHIENTGVSRAILILKEKINKFPNNALLHSNLGYAYEQIRNYKKAREYYRKALKLNPDFTVAEYNLGFNYLKSGNIQKAIEAFKKISKKKPDFTQAKFALGRIYLKLEKYEQALSSFEDVLTKKPDDIKAQYNIVAVYLKMNKGEKAKEYLKTMIKRYSASDDQMSKSFLMMAKLKLSIILYKEKAARRRDNARARSSSNSQR